MSRPDPRAGEINTDPNAGTMQERPPARSFIEAARDVADLAELVEVLAAARGAVVSAAKAVEERALDEAVEAVRSEHNDAMKRLHAARDLFARYSDSGMVRPPLGRS